MRKKDILVIDDEKTVRWGFEKVLKKNGYNVHLAADGLEGLKKFKEIMPPVTILDMKMPVMNGIDVLTEIRKIMENAIVIVVTAFGDMDTTIKAMKLGAYEFINKPFDINKVMELIEKGIETYYTTSSENSGFIEEEIIPNEKIIGNSPAMQDIYKLIGTIANSSVTVLITGESGTGKELIAKTIHDSSNQHSNPFIPINCTAIPEHLIESELFGHVKGAFTGAISDRKGKFELANDGTIFLDEIADMPIEMQAKLLRVLQEKEIVKVGGTKQIKTNVRIIAATNCDLEKAIKEGRLREDLYHRLKVIQIQLPPLRERMEDVPSLINYFLESSNKKMDKHIKGFDEKVLKNIMEYNWPGNIRELQNVVESAVALCRDNMITNNHIPLEIRKENLIEINNNVVESNFEEDSLSKSTRDNLKINVKKLINEELSKIGEIKNGDFYTRIMNDVEKILINEILSKFNGNQLKTAKFLGINRNTLRSKIEKYKL